MEAGWERTSGGVERMGTHGWMGGAVRPHGRRGRGEAARVDGRRGEARTGGGWEWQGTHGRQGGEDGHARVVGWRGED